MFGPVTVVNGTCVVIDGNFQGKKPPSWLLTNVILENQINLLSVFDDLLQAMINDLAVPSCTCAVKCIHKTFKDNF